MRLGADVGGTFTDIILVDDASGEFRLGKVLTTADRPDDAVIAGVRDIISKDQDARRAKHLVHGTGLLP
jgi:N-methylhydantoinase A